MSFSMVSLWPGRDDTLGTICDNQDSFKVQISILAASKVASAKIPTEVAPSPGNDRSGGSEHEGHVEATKPFRDLYAKVVRSEW